MRGKTWRYVNILCLLSLLTIRDNKDMLCQYFCQRYFQWNPNPVGPSDMTDENRFGPAENISFPDRMSGNVFSDNELKKNARNASTLKIQSAKFGQIVFSCGFIFDSREQTFGTIFLLPYVHDKLYCMKSPMFKTLKRIGLLFATSTSYMSWALQRPRQVTFGLMFWVTGSSYLIVNSLLAWDVFQIDDDYEAATDLFNTFLHEKDDQDNYMDSFLDKMSVWENLSMFTREWMY